MQQNDCKKNTVESRLTEHDFLSATICNECIKKKKDRTKIDQRTNRNRRKEKKRSKNYLYRCTKMFVFGPDNMRSTDYRLSKTLMLLVFNCCTAVDL